MLSRGVWYLLPNLDSGWASEGIIFLVRLVSILKSMHVTRGCRVFRLDVIFFVPQFVPHFVPHFQTMYPKYPKLGYILLIWQFCALIFKWTWPTLKFAGLGSMIFGFLNQFHLLVPISRSIWQLWFLRGVGRGRGRSFVFQDSGLQFS